MKKTVLFLDRVHPVLSERLMDEDYYCLYDYKNSIEFIYNTYPDVFGLVIRSRINLTSEVLSRFTNLRFIARSGSGLENIDTVYCGENNIAVFNSPEGNRNAVAEHAMGLLLAMLNNITKSSNQIKRAVWERELNRGEELKGKTIGIIGFGHNGKAFAEKLVSFGVLILAYDKYVEVESNHGIKSASLEEIYELSDVVSLHLPLTDETFYYANKTFFQHFKKNIYFLNIARGKLVETTELVEALKCGKVRATGLDVLEYEEGSFESLQVDETPEPMTYLMSSSSVILTPHIAGWTKESYFLLSDVLADKILSFSFD